jgi:hypothetical protein
VSFLFYELTNNVRRFIEYDKKVTHKSVFNIGTKPGASAIKIRREWPRSVVFNGALRGNLAQNDTNLFQFAAIAIIPS